MITITMSTDYFERISDHLGRSGTEQVVFLVLSQTTAADSRVFQVEDFYIVPQDGLVNESPFHVEVNGDTQAKVIKMAWDRRLALGEIHSHPGSASGTAFSPSDLDGFDEFVPHVWWRLRGSPYVALVFGDSDYDALAWIAGPNAPERVATLTVGARQYPPTGITFEEIQQQQRDQERYSRQIALFGARGQERLRSQRVGIVGLGGLGCHVAQQLAFLGITKFALVDMDVAELSNLNRLITATEKDVGRPKVEVTQDFITRIQPRAVVDAIRETVFSLAAFKAIQSCDFLFVCVDNDGVRLGVLEVCCSFRKPYLDLASDVEADGSFGGRLIFTGLGKGCPFCREELDSKEIWRYFARPDQRAEDDRIYGVKRSDLAGGGPSVVALNGVIASHAVTEFMAHVTGLRPPQAHLIYRGTMGIVTKGEVPDSGCYYCCDIWNGVAKPDLAQYLHQRGSGPNQEDAA